MITSLPWDTEGARLEMPRDLQVAYVVGRMGLATSLDIWPLFWNSRRAARTTFLRLQKLGLIRTFPRCDPSRPAWYALAPRAVELVASEMECDPRELRTVSGIRRLNKAAICGRNRFWVSLVLGCRATPDVELLLFRPEWELRRLKPSDINVVPDAQIVLGDDAQADDMQQVWLVEFDAGTERLSVWESKARAYCAARGYRAVYGAQRWQVIALVPSMRRARSVAAAATRGGAGSFIFVGVTDTFDDGRALGAAFWPATELAADPNARPRWSLLGEHDRHRQECHSDTAMPQPEGVL